MREPTECPFALSTSGCDFGNSGVGVFAREVVPRLVSSLHRRGLRSILVGSRAERIGIGVDPSSGFRLPSALDAPGPNALFAFAALPLLARAARARALYLPAANRRVVALPTVPTVGTVHDLAQFHVENKYGRARDLYVRRILTPTLRRLSLVLAVSEVPAPAGGGEAAAGAAGFWSNPANRAVVFGGVLAAGITTFVITDTDDDDDNDNQVVPPAPPEPETPAPAKKPVKKDTSRPAPASPNV